MRHIYVIWLEVNKLGCLVSSEVGITGLLMEGNQYMVIPNLKQT